MVIATEIRNRYEMRKFLNLERASWQCTCSKWVAMQVSKPRMVPINGSYMYEAALFR